MKTLEPDRVRRHTPPQTNLIIDETINATVQYYSSAPREELSRRITQLEKEWDIERVLETNASVLALAGLTLAVSRGRLWLAVSGTVLGFLLLHGTQGWCPPLPVFRRMGIRTRSEIERERLALKFVRGDFDHVRDHEGKINLSRLLMMIRP